MAQSFNSFIERIVSKNSLVFIALFLAAFLAYGNILPGGFVFDDNIFIENNLQIRSPSNVGEIYRSSTTAGSGLTGDNFYRPNQQLVYTILYDFFGLKPFFFHLVSVLFHILNGFLVFLLFIRLSISRRTAFYGALIFILHPILTESVSYISGLSDPMVTVSILSTLLVFLEILKDIDLKKYLKWLAIGALVFTIGLFSKENQIVSLGLIALLGIYKYKKKEISNIWRAVIFLGILCVLSSLYLYARVGILNFTGVLGLTSEVNAYTGSIWVRFMTFVHIFPEYFKMMLFPLRLNYEKPYAAYMSFHGFESISSIILLLVGSFYFIRSLIKMKDLHPARKGGKDAGKLFIGLGWFMVALIPVSGIIPTNAMYLEHWLYLPIIGMIFAACCGIEILPDRWQKRFPYILLVVLILFSARIIVRNIEWGDPVKFYTHELKYTDKSARIYNNLAMELSDRGDCDKAIENYKKAISLNDSYPQTHHNLARCYEQKGELLNAAQEYLKALSMNPNFIYSLNGLAKLFTDAKDTRAPSLVRLAERVQNGEKIELSDIDKALSGK